MPEDIMNVGSNLGKKFLGFVFKKFLEGKFGVKFPVFNVNEFFLALAEAKTFTRTGEAAYEFRICVSGEIDKSDLVKLLNKEESK